MECRNSCGACCIEASITEFIPGMPAGKPAGVECIHLDQNLRCRIFNSVERPITCGLFKAEFNVCGSSREQALQNIRVMEMTTLP